MITKEQKVKFLEKLGYTVEDITYKIWHCETRSSEEYYTGHEISLAYIVENETIKEFKESKTHVSKAEQGFVGQYILDKIYDRQFEQALYKVVYNSIAEIAE